MNEPAAGTADDAGDETAETDATIETDETIETIETTIEPIDITNPDVMGTARRRYGKGVGSIVAAGMFGLDIALGNKKKPESVQIQESPSDPIDVDSDGIQVQIDDSLAVHSPPLERKAPIGVGKKKPRR